MAFDDRLLALFVGLSIGFVLGYLTRLMQGMKEIKEELDEVDTIVKENLGNHHEGNESGFMRYPWVANFAVLVIVAITAWAAIVSQKASNDVQASQDRIEEVVVCLQTTLADVLESLNERGTYTTEVASANIDLQQAQSDLFDILRHKPPYSEERRQKAGRDYYQALQRFLEVAQKNRGKLVTNPLPTVQDFTTCLAN